LDLVSFTAEKNMLRVQMRRHRRALADAAPEAAEQAARHLPIERFKPFGVVAGYHPIGAELDPRPLMRRLAALGAVVTLPVAVQRDAPLVFRLAGGPRDFVLDAFGIAGPPPSATEHVPNLVIAPVLAFDRAGGRLGQGAGSYDRTLQALRAAGAVFVLGLAYRGQEVDGVPGDVHDQRLDAILTENGYREV